MKINTTLILAVFRRNLSSYFMNPSGYVFLTLFIFLSAAAAFWRESFFQNNLANLDQLNQFFPYLLLFFIPALTMSVWAEERKQGTDELLLTLPATDLEITLGKYLAALGLYSGALILSLSHVIVLMFLGDPDLGLMFANYIGFWLIGAALVAVGMLASLLTANVTIAFILGALFCAALVFVDSPQIAFSDFFGSVLEPVGLFANFGDFSKGVISLSGIVYFLSLAGLALYLNVVMLGRRHWRREVEMLSMRGHHAIRVLALLVAVLSLNTVVAHSSLRLDVTSEGLHSLSDETERLLAELPADRPVLIQAFVSAEVPRQLVETRANLLGFLREIDALAGDRVQVLIHQTEMFTQEARDARDKFAITPREMLLSESSRSIPGQVFMGVAFTCGAQEDVIPFFERGLPVEYSLIRSVRTVAQTSRKRIGALKTEAKMFGGFDFQTFKSSPAWPVVEELKKQFEVVEISATEPITEELDGLLVALPSSLTQAEIDNLREYIKAGNPTMLLVDPLPTMDLALSPVQPRGSGGNPFARNQQPQQDPKGNIRQLLAEVGVDWNAAEIAWDTYNPHPELATLPLEVVFIGAGNDSPEPFNASYPATSGLQELVMLYPGILRAGPNPDLNFEPLLTTGPVSGMLSWPQVVNRSFFGASINSNPRHVQDGLIYTLAAHVSGPLTKSIAPAAAGIDSVNSKDSNQRVNLTVIADLDFISSQFFHIRNMGHEQLNFDNVTFFLNVMDMLVGDTSFIDLRKKRLRHRTLETVENRTSEFYARRVQEEKQSEQEAQNALNEAQQRLNEKVAEVSSRADLDQQTKSIMMKNLQETENRRFEVVKAGIQAAKETEIQRSKENMELAIRGIQSGIKTYAVAIPPAPALLFGLLIFLRRRRREAETVNVRRLLRR